MRLLLAAMLVTLTVACSEEPAATPFEAGEAASAPYGCEKAKEEGRDVKC